MRSLLVLFLVAVGVAAAAKGKPVLTKCFQTLPMGDKTRTCRAVTDSQTNEFMCGTPAADGVTLNVTSVNITDVATGLPIVISETEEVAVCAEGRAFYPQGYLAPGERLDLAVSVNLQEVHGMFVPPLLVVDQILQRVPQSVSWLEPILKEHLYTKANSYIVVQDICGMVQAITSHANYSDIVNKGQEFLGEDLAAKITANLSKIATPSGDCSLDAWAGVWHNVSQCVTAPMPDVPEQMAIELAQMLGSTSPQIKLGVFVELLKRAPDTSDNYKYNPKKDEMTHLICQYVPLRINLPI